MAGPTHGADPAGGPVLVLNAGSSTVKFALVDVGSGARPLTGVADRLGSPDATLTIQLDGAGDGAGRSEVSRDMANGGHDEAVTAVLDEISHAAPAGRRVLAVGHRVVHGGERFTRSVLIDDDVVAAIEDFARLAPLHNPPALQGIRAARRALPDVPHAAVFDTAFHQTMPPRAYRYAIPEPWYADLGIRRYGFHGTSHRFVSSRAAELLGRPPADLALVVAHLGNGCSAAAVLAGASVDTTMGLTPLEGLVMGTRSGDVDPGMFGYLAAQSGLDVSEITRQLNIASGLLGLSGLSNDMRTVIEAAERGDGRAALALDVFGYRLAKAVAALVVGMGRLDALVFTGGIGENAPAVRSRVVDRLGFLGLALDGEANQHHGRGTAGRISAGDSPAVLVVPTDEELLIAQDAARLAQDAVTVRT